MSTLEPLPLNLRGSPSRHPLATSKPNFPNLRPEVEWFEQVCGEYTIVAERAATALAVLHMVRTPPLTAARRVAHQLREEIRAQHEITRSRWDKLPYYPTRGDLDHLASLDNLADRLDQFYKWLCAKGAP